MNRVKKKLNSRKGASITWALLIFLVCAVVGSAVLVAGTAAAGRMSKLAENDQRYYAVTSAARLLINELESNTVFVEKDSSGGGSITYKNSQGAAITSMNSLACEAAYLVAHDGGSGSITLTVNGGAGALAPLAVTITDTMVKNLSGSIEKYEYTLLLENTQGTDKYRLKLIFNSDDIEPLVITETGTTTEIRKVSWHLKDIQVDGAQRWA